MDFSFSSDQQELRALTNRILTDTCTAERLKTVSLTDTAVDHDLWKAFAEAGLVGIGLPESVGGGGYGWLETCIVLEGIGRFAAPLPAIAVMALGAPALADAAAKRPELLGLLNGVATGDVVVTAAIHEPIGDPWTPATTVSATDGKLTGTKICVPSGLIAARFVVTAADGLYVVEANAPGVGIQRQDTTSGIPDALVTFTATAALRIGGVHERDNVIRRGTSAACIVLSGSCAVIRFPVANNMP